MLDRETGEKILQKWKTVVYTFTVRWWVVCRNIDAIDNRHYRLIIYNNSRLSIIFTSWFRHDCFGVILRYRYVCVKSDRPIVVKKTRISTRVHKRSQFFGGKESTYIVTVIVIRICLRSAPSAAL